MDFLREIVGGPKNRYKQDGFNLDLTYITPRLIAMAYPATGFQKLYRNPIEAVCQFLAFKHGSKYITINLSNREVDDKMLKNVHAFDWDDHKPPGFDTLFKICDIMAKYLISEPQGVAVIHCNHGKGRTGTLISCFLLYSGLFKNSGQAMKYYADKRFEKEGQGVTQPGQITYIKYFSRILKYTLIIPQVVYIRRVVFSGGHHLHQPYLKLRNASNKDELFSTKKNNTVLVSDSDNKITWKFSEEILFAGDFFLQIKQQSKIGKNLVGGYSFNTGFIPIEGALEVNLNELSPHSLHSSGLFDLNFKMQIYFRTACKCQFNIPISERCAKCKEKLIAEEPKYEQIEKALKYRQTYVLKSKDQLTGLKNINSEEFQVVKPE